MTAKRLLRLTSTLISIIQVTIQSQNLGTRKCSYLVFNTLFAPAFNRVDPTFNPEKALKEVEFNLKYVDGILSKSNYIVGEFPSLADLSAFY